MGLWVGGALERGEDLAALGEETVRGKSRGASTGRAALNIDTHHLHGENAFSPGADSRTLGAWLGRWRRAAPQPVRPVGARWISGWAGAVAKGAAAGAILNADGCSIRWV
jgi:hypothetical protein